MRNFLKILEAHFSKKLSLKKLDYCFLDPKKIFFSKKINLKIKKLKGRHFLKIIFPKNFRAKNPIIFCFGVFEKAGQLRVVPEIEIGENSSLKILSFCWFPNSKKVFHQMKGKIILKENSNLIFEEKHHHGSFSGTSLEASYEIEIFKRAHLSSRFHLLSFTAGRLNLKYYVLSKENSFFESEIKVLGNHKEDKVRIEEEVILSQKQAKANLRLRGVAKNKASIFLLGKIEASAKGTYGHLDCKEIILDKNASVITLPQLKVTHPLASLTHEASIGRVNPEQVELLISKGLSKKKALDFILKGLLK